MCDMISFWCMGVMLLVYGAWFIGLKTQIVTCGVLLDIQREPFHMLLFHIYYFLNSQSII